VTHEKADGPVTIADRLANHIIVNELQAVFPPREYGCLSEEIDHGAGRLRRERVWIIDPIDGTHDFIDRLGNFCIQIGLVRRWRRSFVPAAAVVYHPTTERVYAALRGRGAWVEDAAGRGRPRRLRVSRRKGPAGLRALTSRSHSTPALVDLVKAFRPSRIVSMGSMGLKICRIASGEADFYVTIGLGATKEWDSCAPHLILSEAGGCLTDLRGQELSYNGRDVRRHFGLLATNGRSHEGLLLAIRAHFANPGVQAPPGLREMLGIRGVAQRA
jgi:3'(2'), 5'-bisphosphate nucleotidase